ncbi:MAG: heme biosynthesis HemY N-terminal domain-containing protein [Candidatus Azotimanducaceae bacterium]
MRWLWVFLAAISGALAGATLLQDPGYVMVRAGDLVFESSIAAAVLSLLLVAVAAFFLSFVVRRMLQSLGLLGKWRVARQQSKTIGGWRRAVLAAAAGDWSTAARAVDGISIEPDRQLDRALITARHLVQNDDPQSLNALVDQISAEHPHLLAELQVSIARWQIEAGAVTEAFDRLSNLPPSTQWAGLYAWSCVSLHRWKALAAHWQQVEKYGVLKSAVFRPQMIMFRAGKAMADSVVGHPGGKAIWQAGLKGLPKQWRADANTLDLWATFLVQAGREVQARELVLHALAKSWQPVLIRRLGLLCTIKPLATAVEQATELLTKHPQDTELLLAVARLLRADNRPNEARRHLMSAGNRLRSDPPTSEEAEELRQLVAGELGQLALLNAGDVASLSAH